jgi:hypothetical protein
MQYFTNKFQENLNMERIYLQQMNKNVKELIRLSKYEIIDNTNLNENEIKKYIDLFNDITRVLINNKDMIDNYTKNMIESLNKSIKEIELTVAIEINKEKIFTLEELAMISIKENNIFSEIPYDHPVYDIINMKACNKLKSD